MVRIPFRPLIAAAVLAVSACALQQPIQKVENAPVATPSGKPLTAAQVRQAIITAGTALGWTVLRFWNDDVLRDVDDICLHIVTVVGISATDAAAQAAAAGKGTLTEEHRA